MPKKQRKYIKIRGANEHNLKAIDIDIPRDEFVVLTGLSGSGKSSLAFDTIYAEGQRRYLDRWKSQTWNRSKDSRRQYPSTRNRPTVTHVLRSEL